ncbi:MAG: hypothetical protein ACQGVC_05585 [Myxococcota bacterium]
MKKIVRWGVIVLAALVGALLGTAFAARFADGPIAAFPGGALASGEWVETQGLDWSFAADRDTLELQLLEPESSRTVWGVVHEGALYVPCGVPHFTLWKQWPHHAVKDGRAVLRIDGKRYAVSLVRAPEDERLAAGRATVEKYGVGTAEGLEDPDAFWAFRVEPRERAEDG